MVNLQKPSLSQKIFNTLRDKIVFMEYPPGMNFSEKELCKEFKVSRTPLREAFRRLEDMKLVTVIPRYGTYVSQIDINEIRCAFEVKIKLEGLAGQVAAKRITADKLEELQNLMKSAEVMLKENGTGSSSKSTTTSTRLFISRPRTLSFRRCLRISIVGANASGSRR